MRRHLSSLIGYGLSVAVSAVVTLLTIPILIGSSGATAWASLAVGQAVGTGAAIVIGYGWGTTGPTAVAQAVGQARVRIYAESFRARLLIAGPILAIGVVVTLLATQTVPVEAALNSLGYGLTGLLAGWYFTGIARPYLFLLLDTVPRIVGAAAGAGVILLGAPLITFTLLQLAGVLIGIVASTRFIASNDSLHFREVPTRQTVRVLRRQSHGIAIALVAAAWSSIPISIVAVFAPSGLAAYALVDKLLRFGTTAYAPIIQFLQGWVPTGSRELLLQKVRKAFVLGTVLAVVGAVMFVALGPWLAGLLSHGEVIPGRFLVVGFGVALLFMVMSQVCGLVCLLALDRAQLLARMSVITVLIGLPAVIVGALLGGANGAAWLLAAAECLSFSLQLRLLINAVAESRAQITTTAR